MKKNLESVAQRGEHIDQLQDKSENLNQSAQGFRRGANRVRKQMWWKNMKMRIWIIVGIIVLLLIIIIPSGKPKVLSFLCRVLLANGHKSLPRNIRILFERGTRARCSFSRCLHKGFFGSAWLSAGPSIQSGYSSTQLLAPSHHI